MIDRAAYEPTDDTLVAVKAALRHAEAGLARCAARAGEELTRSTTAGGSVFTVIDPAGDANAELISARQDQHTLANIVQTLRARQEMVERCMRRAGV